MKALTVVGILAMVMVITLGIVGFTRVRNSAVQWEYVPAQVWATSDAGFTVMWNKGEHADMMDNVLNFQHYRWPTKGAVQADTVYTHQLVTMLNGYNRKGVKVNEHLRFSDEQALICSYTYKR